ncbi:DODA-type extradiol aromatic ring-opening family dioxygenase [Paenibacillus sp. TAB 01]|uniref:DODA-type extradiol aromatic ring-opening family dioxygenase n=1 Tax=Paenibacillus sp. TAB 01 TaxID=3368988 RepID=UPI0037523AF3
MGASYFIGHGSPMLAIQDIPYTQELNKLGASLGKPEAVVVFTAHWAARELSVTSTDAVYETIYDFGGFPDELYRVVYPARGSKKLADEVIGLFAAAGLAARPEEKRGLDHGVWVLLRHLFPEADVPVIAVSVNPLLPPEQQYKIGQALAPLLERNIVVIGSGATIHNFREMNFHAENRADDWAKEFDDWLIEHMQSWDTASLFGYKQLAPHAVRATPDYEHFLPLFLAMGAGDARRRMELLTQIYLYGSLSHLIVKF